MTMNIMLRGIHLTSWNICRVRMSTVAAQSAAIRPKETTEDFTNARPFTDIPGPKGLPYIGSLLEYKKGPYQVKRFHDAILARYREYGPIYKETLAGTTTLHLLDPDYIKTVYTHEGKTPHAPPLLVPSQMYRKHRKMSPGLGNINGEEWYRLRSAVQKMMMRPKAITTYLQMVDEVVDDFIERWKSILDPISGQIDNFDNEMKKWNLESSAATGFQTRFGCLEAGPESHQQHMINANTAIFIWSLKMQWALPWYKIFPTQAWKELVKAEDAFVSHGQKLVDETVGKIQELADSCQLREGQYEFLSNLLTKKQLTYEDLSIITLSLLGDGLSTTVPSLIGLLYCLATNQEKQQKLYEELCKVVSPQKPVTEDMMSGMSYLKACVKEGFRFFPVGVEVSRIPQKDMVIGGYHVPSGTVIQLNNNLLLKLPEYFARPNDYLPERWLRGSTHQKSHPYLLIPFGHGPRMCTGRRIVEQEMYVFLAKLLTNFRIEWPHQYPMNQEYRILLLPDRPGQFKFIPRY